MRKGIKLDFKLTNVLLESFEIVRSKLERLNCPLWINADIVKGPQWMQGLGSLRIVDGNTFLALLNQYIPQATVSPGKNQAFFRLIRPFTYPGLPDP